MKTRIKVLLPLLFLLALPAVVQAQFMFTTNSGTITITHYYGSAFDAVTIPSTTNGYPVTSIAGYAFFSGWLSSLTIPNSITNIAANAFKHCILPSLTIPDSVITIGATAFQDNPALTNAFIGTNVTSIGSNAFYLCTSLTALTVDTNNPVYSSRDGVLFDKSQTTLLTYPEGKTGAYTIPNSVTSIGSNAFYNCVGLTNVAIPDSVTNIEDNAFYASGLTVATIPDSVTSIGNYAFDLCSNLTSAVIGISVLTIGHGAFENCGRLTSVTIPNSLTSIAAWAWADCSRLISVTIPSSVTNIGDGAFYGCGSLISVYFMGNVPSLGGSWVFADAWKATLYYLPGTMGWVGFSPNGRLTAPWLLPNPLILNNSPSFGVQTNQFGFIISWATNIPVVVEACTSLANTNWSSVGTNTLTGGWSYFSDPQWTSYPARFYRLRSP